jgi:hypothetical protein
VSWKASAGPSSGALECRDPLLVVSVGVVLAPLVGGLYYFRRTEKTFADVV